MSAPAPALAEAHLRAFFTAAPAGLAMLDAQLRYLRVNETLAAMNGLPAADHVGRSVREALPQLAPTLEPILAGVLATGEAALNIEVAGETEAQPGAPRRWLASYFPLPGPDGGPVGIGAIVVEDTRRRQLEDAQRRSGEEFRAIVEQAAHGIYRSSVEGKLLRVNPALAQMLGYASPAELLGLELARDVYVEPSERDRLIAQYQAAETIRGVEVTWKRKDGHHILVRLSGRPLRGDAGEVVGFSMLAEDITDQRTLERALQQAQKMQAVGELTSGIAHDFNNLLTVILGQVSLLAGGLPPERTDLRRDLAVLEDAAARGAGFVRRLLGFSRREALVLRTLDLTTWAGEALELVERLLPATIAVELEADPEAVWVEADPGALEQVLLNLATNARDAMPAGGILHVTVRRTPLFEEDRRLRPWIRPGLFACLTVSDTGVGMDPGTMAQAFEPFFTTKPVGVGTGLGLAMVYGLVKQHQGFVHLDSEPDRGTTVKIYLPLAAGAAAAGVPAQGPAALPRGTERVLLVEDEERLRVVAERLLRKVGYTVVPVADGAQGLDVYRTYRTELDVVVTDLVMPGLRGDQLYDAIRDEGGRVKVLFTSGHPAPEFRERTRGDPAVEFVMKPWTATELLSGIRSLLDRR